MFGLVIGLGMITLQKFGDSVVTCADIGGDTATWNATTQLCANSSGATGAGSGAGYTAISYVGTQMGSSGLAGWIPLIIVVLIAGLIFAYFGMGKKKY